MTIALDLGGSRAKLGRAKEHVETLRAKIALAGHPDPRVIPLRRKYEPEFGAVVYRIERVIRAGDDWGLIVGDAVHNMRSALDHLAWALAVRHFGGVAPTDDKIVRDIQFPVFSDAKHWPTHRYLKHMDPADVDILEQFQPFKLPSWARLVLQMQRPGVIPHALEALVAMSNSDKHRVIQVLYVLALSGHLTVTKFTDCRPASQADDSFGITVTPPGQPPRVGDEVFRVPVVPTGTNPDVDLGAYVSAYVAVGKQHDVLEALDAFAVEVKSVLDAFAPSS
jgi:hypothetical protein